MYCKPATQRNRKIFNIHLNSAELRQYIKYNGNFETSMFFVFRLRISTLALCAMIRFVYYSMISWIRMSGNGSS